jgi:predicted XRE-type DNA-binding protein
MSSKNSDSGKSAQLTTVDARVRHVTKQGANLFLELGFSAAEAKRLHAASREQSDDTLRLKEQLMTDLSNWIEEHQLKQAEAAQILMVSRRQVSDIIHRKAAKFSIDCWWKCSRGWVSR